MDSGAMSTTATANGRCLIVEDNFLISMDLEEMLKSMGFKVIDQATTLQQATDLLARMQYSVVLLDLTLGIESSLPLVNHLKQLKIPFAITTGYQVDQSRAPYHDVPVISKPYLYDKVSRTLVELLRSPRPV